MKEITRRHWDNHSLLTELLVAVLILFAISVAIITSISIKSFERLSEELYRKNLEDSSELLEDTIRTKLSDLYANAYIFGTDSTLKSYKQSYGAFKDDPLSYVKLNNYVVEQLSQMETFMDDILSASIYLFDGNIFHTYTSIPRKDMNFDVLFDEGNITSRSGILSMLTEMENPIFIQASKTIPVVFDFSDSYLICFISVDKLAGLTSSYYSSFFDDVEILDRYGNMLKESGKGIDYAGTKDGGKEEVTVDGKEFVLLSTSLPILNWTISLAKDNSAITSRLLHYILFLAAAVAILMALVYTAILKIYSRFRIPFNRLSALMSENSSRLNYEHFDYPGKNEIGQLGKLYNEMIDEIRSLVCQLEDKIVQLEEEKKMKEWEQEQKRIAEIKALQAQINPHFLYNALNSIVWIAEDNGDKEVKEITLRLANYYRTGLSKGSDMIQMQEELKHAENYLWIQCQRYDRITFSINAEKELDQVLVPKLILQPLIENAIYHGIKPVGGGGCINVTVSKEGDSVVFTVANTGAPIQEERREKLNKNLSDGVMDSSTGYGIYNVNARIKLTYGQQWGLSLESSDGWTRAMIRIPSRGCSNEYPDS